MIVPPPLHRLADALRQVAPSCGTSRLVAVDGHAGSGKSTFATLLSTALGGAPVLPLDALATHAEPFEWTERIRRQVLEPLRRDEPARYLPYDWNARTFGSPRVLPAAPVVLVEGVGAGRAALRPWLARLLWMELPRDEAWRRGRQRDGPALAAFWDGWIAAERAHFAADPSRPFAHHLVKQRRTDDALSDDASVSDTPGQSGPEWFPGPTRPLGYEVVPGPAGPPTPGVAAREAYPGHHPE